MKDIIAEKEEIELLDTIFIMMEEFCPTENSLLKPFVKKCDKSKGCDTVKRIQCWNEAIRLYKLSE